MTSLLHGVSESAVTAVGFFWKAGWAFVLGYLVSAMIQVFVPKRRLTRAMGDPGPRSIALATGFGAVSSSCSFAALAAARSLVQKGAHFVAAVAFMFASTNLVIELGILILIFLGWPYLAAEILGGLLLIAISSAILRLVLPESWGRAARERLQRRSGDDEEDFDWRRRIRSAEGWRRVGHRFVMDWRMVWEEIVIGFTIAGFVAVLVPSRVWTRLFLAAPLENALVAPLVAAATFIGSMGNIPLATVLNANGVAFAGIIAFIYSDLMVPPLVAINAKYYGWRIALTIAGVMYASIVATALILHRAFEWLDVTPASGRRIEEITRFGLDYTLVLNLAFALVAAAAVLLHRRHGSASEAGGRHDAAGSGLSPKRAVVYVSLAVVVVGLVVRAGAAVAELSSFS